jgi:hypothetical protein
MCEEGGPIAVLYDPPKCEPQWRSSLAAHQRDLAGLNCPERVQTGRYKHKKILQPIRPRPQDENGEFSSCEILLETNAMVDGHQKLEARPFRCQEEFAISESSEAGITSRLTVVIRKGIAKCLVYALVDQDPHSGASIQESVGFLEGGDRQVPGNGGKSPQKALQRFAAFQIIEQGFDRHASSAKDRSAAENLGISGDNLLDAHRKPLRRG